MKYKLSELFELQMGKTPDRKNTNFWNTHDNKWLSIADLSKSDKFVSETKEYISNEAVTQSGIKKIPSNTVVMSFKLSIGKVAICKEELYSNEAIMAFLDKGKTKLLPDYLYYLFLCKNWEENTNKAVMGHTLNKATLSEMTVDIHDYSEQQQIADTLDRVSHLLTLRHQQLEKLDLLVKSRFVEMFGDIINNSKFNMEPMTFFATVGSSKRIFANEYKEDGIPFYRSKEIRELGEGLKPSIELFITEERYECIKKQFGIPKKGDILIAAIGATIGYTWLINTDEPFYYKDGNLILLSIKDNINSVFLNYALISIIRDFKDRGAAGSAQLALTIEKVEKMLMPNAPLDLQNQFAAFVQQVDKSKFVIKQSIEKLELLKKKLMQDYFG